MTQSQCWLIVSTTKISVKFQPNTAILIQENIFEKVACEMTSILSMGRWIKALVTIILFNFLPDEWPSLNWQEPLLTYCGFVLSRMVPVFFLFVCLFVCLFFLEGGGGQVTNCCMVEKGHRLKWTYLWWDTMAITWGPFYMNFSK